MENDKLMIRTLRVLVLKTLLLGLAWMVCRLDVVAGGLDYEARIKAFRTPPAEARPWCYWWWINGDVTRDGIVRDLDHMANVGIGGALVFHGGGGMTKTNITFMSPEWRALFKFAVEEAAKRNLVIGINPCNGYCAGGPWVPAEDGPHFLDSTSVSCQGPGKVALKIPAPKPEGTVYYEDIAVLAWRVDGGRSGALDSKSLVDLTPFLKDDTVEWAAPAGMWTVMRLGCRNASSEHRCYIKCGDFFYMGRGILTYTRSGEVVKHWELDPLKAEAMEHHFSNTVEILARDVGEHAGKTLKYLQIDSSELGTPDWTAGLREAFRQRRGYDPLPFLAATVPKGVVDSREVTDRFREDFNRTLGELMVGNYYGRLAQLAHRHGMLAASQGAGQQKPRLDALASLGGNDICEGEYWTHMAEPPVPETAPREPAYPHANLRVPDYIHQMCEPLLLNHDSIRTAASAAHTYGRQIVMAEAFSHGAAPQGCFPGHDSYPYTLKDVGDRAFCAGLNRNQFCFVVHQPEAEAKPGNTILRWGTDLNRNLTWWPMGKAWIAYLSRCQYLLQAGRFAADVCYFPGEWVPNYIPARWANNPELPLGFDCDTVNAEVLREGVVGDDGRLELKSGMRYRYLVFRRGGPWKFTNKMTRQEVLDEQRPMAMSPGTLAKIKTLVEGGMTLVGSRPVRAIGLTDYPRSDAEVARLADELWGKDPAAAGERKVGKGRVVWGKTLAQVFAADGVKPDLEIKEDAATAALSAETLSNIPNPGGSFDWIHRTEEGLEVYFIANLRRVEAAGVFTFRVAGKNPFDKAQGRPELWDPVTGEIRDLPEFSQAEDGRTQVPMRFAARQSFFVVFRRQTEDPGLQTTDLGSQELAPPKEKGSPKDRGGRSSATPPQPRCAAADATGSQELAPPKEKGSPTDRGGRSSATPPNFPEYRPVMELAGPWDVQFDPKWFYAGGEASDPGLQTGDPNSAKVVFEKLEDWIQRPEEAVKHFSGTAVYRKTFDCADAGKTGALYLDLGTVRVIAGVRLNGQDLGVVWTAPWRVDISKVVKAKGNELEIRVSNLWPNRLIGDAGLPPQLRRTKSNFPETMVKPDMPLFSSGLLGPVTIQRERL